MSVYIYIYIKIIIINKKVGNHFSVTLDLIYCLGSLIYRVRGIDPDGDKLIFGVREPGDKAIRVENFGRSEANIYLKIELDREVIEHFNIRAINERV